MSVTMQGRAKVCMKNAYQNLNDSKLGTAIDDAYFDIACFNAQQALEFVLKAVLLEYGIPYDKEHDIFYLCDLISSKTNFHFTKQKEVEVLSHTITDWEEKGRYGFGIRTTEQTVRRVLNICKDIDYHLVVLQLSKHKEEKSAEHNTKEDEENMER